MQFSISKQFETDSKSITFFGGCQFSQLVSPSTPFQIEIYQGANKCQVSVTPEFLPTVNHLRFNWRSCRSATQCSKRNSRHGMTTENNSNAA